MGVSAAYDLDDELQHGGVPEHSGVEERGRKQPSLSRAPTMPLGSAVEAVAEEPPASRPWCVDHGDFLEAMSTIALWNALETGTLPQETRVWREGLECWARACDVQALTWTVSQHTYQCGEAVASAEGLCGPESTGPLSFALTPDDLRAVAPRWILDGSAAAVPESTRDQRAETLTLHSRPALGPVAWDDALSAPISLELPPSFPGVPSSGSDAPASAPVTLPSGPQPAPAPLRAAGVTGEPCETCETCEKSTKRGPASGVWTRVVRRARARRDTLPVAAGSAIAAIAIGLAVLNAITPPRAPFPAAQIGFASSAAFVAARVALPALPAAAAEPTLSRLAGAAVPEREAPTQQAARVVFAPASARAPVDRRERGQYRLRRGHLDTGVARGVHRPGS